MISTLSERSRKTAATWIAAVVLCLLFFLSVKDLFISPEKVRLSDFANYYYGSLWLTEGADLNILQDAADFNSPPDSKGEVLYLPPEEIIFYTHFVNYTPIPPFSILFYLPLTPLLPQFAFLIWNLLGAAIFLICLIRLFRHFGLDLSWLPAVMICMLIPLKSNLQAGQSYLLIFALLSEGFIAWNGDKKWLAALLWAIAFHLKLFPGIVLLFLFFIKDWRSILYFLLISCGLALLTFAVCGSEISRRYIFEIMPRLANGEINDTYAISYQSMQVFLKRLFVPDRLHNPGAMFNNPQLYLLLLLGFKLTILSLAALQRKSIFASFSGFIFCSLLVSGYGTTYALVLLIFPLLALLQNVSRLSKISILLLFAFCVSLPVHRFPELAPAMQFTRLWLMLLLFVLYSYFFISKADWKPVIMLALPLLLLFFSDHRKASGDGYFFDKEEALLVRKFLIEQDSLVFEYKDGSGFHEKKKALGFKVKTEKSIAERQSKPFRIRNRIVLNDSIELFLSDENRGVGFYTIRERKLK